MKEAMDGGLWSYSATAAYHVLSTPLRPSWTAVSESLPPFRNGRAGGWRPRNVKSQEQTW